LNEIINEKSVHLLVLLTYVYHDARFIKRKNYSTIFNGSYLTNETMQCSYRPSDSIQIPDEAIHTSETLSRQTDLSVSEGYNLFTVK